MSAERMLSVDEGVEYGPGAKFVVASTGASLELFLDPSVYDSANESDVMADVDRVDNGLVVRPALPLNPGRYVFWAQGVGQSELTIGTPLPGGQQPEIAIEAEQLGSSHASVIRNLSYNPGEWWTISASLDGGSTWFANRVVAGDAARVVWLESQPECDVGWRVPPSSVLSGALVARATAWSNAGVESAVTEFEVPAP
jgi:hypothetical protein